MSDPNPALARATAALLEAVPQAAADPLRPLYHFRPPAQWMNDPNGTIYADGVYHVFYQLNPYADSWGEIHWGHATSRDMVHWEHQPIALWPSQELGEAHCFSGCAAITAQGEPLLLYTSVHAGDRGQRPPNQQWGALGDATWTTWTKHPANPILDPAGHDGPEFDGAWRDPYVFHADGRTFLVLAAGLGDEAAVALYEALDGDLTNWRYRGLIHREPRSQTQYCECPNFFQVDGTWLLLMSPYRPVEFFTGEFDVETFIFQPEHHGILDPGVSAAGPQGHYYATNTLVAPDGRCILLGWVRGWEAGRGWNGCLALPRVLTIGPDRLPRQAPVAELSRLRGPEQRMDAQALPAGATVVATSVSSCSEIAATVAADGAWSLQLRASDASEATLTVTVATDGIRMGEVHVPLTLDLAAGVDLRLFVDRSVVELFAAEGRVAVTLVQPLPTTLMEVDIVSEAGATVKELAVWELNPIW